MGNLKDGHFFLKTVHESWLISSQQMKASTSAATKSSKTKLIIIIYLLVKREFKVKGFTMNMYINYRLFGWKPWFFDSGNSGWVSNVTIEVWPRETGFPSLV